MLAFEVLVELGGGVICLVNSVNERDLSLLTSHANFYAKTKAVLMNFKAENVAGSDWGGLERA